MPARRRSVLPRPPANNRAAPAERGGGGGRTEAEREVGGSRASLPPGCLRPPLPSGFSGGRCASPGVPPPMVGEGKLCRPGGGRGASGGGGRSGGRGRHRSRPVAHHPRRCAGRRRGAPGGAGAAAGRRGRGAGAVCRAEQSRAEPRGGFPCGGAGWGCAAAKREKMAPLQCSRGAPSCERRTARPWAASPSSSPAPLPSAARAAPARRHPPLRSRWGGGGWAPLVPPGLSAEGSRCRPVKVCGEPSAPSLFCPTKPAGLAPGAQPGPRARSSARCRAESRGTRLFLGTCPSLCPMLLFQTRAGKR